MRRRRAKRPPELTPLIDVLFILLFATLVQARSTVQRAQSADLASTTQTAPDAGLPETRDAGVAPMPMDAAVPDATGAIDAAPDAPGYLAQSRTMAENMAKGVFGRSAFVVEVREDGYLTALARWLNGREVQRARLRHRLLRPVRDQHSDVGVMYAEKLCSLARAYAEPMFGAPAAHSEATVGEMLLLVILDVPFDDLPLALSRGLMADLENCFDSARGIAVVLQPGGKPIEFP